MDMERYILNCSRGLAEVIRSSNPFVQFIYESVREYLLKEDSLVNLWPGFRDISAGVSHERLKVCCYNYMKFSKTRHSALAASMSCPKALDLNLPFLEYAMSHLLNHANLAEKHGFTQESFIENVTPSDWFILATASVPSNRWIGIDKLWISALSSWMVSTN